MTKVQPSRCDIITFISKSRAGLPMRAASIAKLKLAAVLARKWFSACTWAMNFACHRFTSEPDAAPMLRIVIFAGELCGSTPPTAKSTKND